MSISSSIKRLFWPIYVTYRRKRQELSLLERESIASVYIYGEGLEIGALNAPLKAEKAKIKYVDRMSLEELRQTYPELKNKQIAPPGIIADGETLKGVQDNSQDFVIANHFLEHCENPILTLQNMLRVIRPYGVLFITLPDRDKCFDSARPVTTVAHIIKDFQDGPGWSRKEHYREFAEKVLKLTGPAVQAKVEQMLASNENIHFHTWTADAFLSAMLSVKEYLNHSFEIELFARREYEFTVILRKP